MREKIARWKYLSFAAIVVAGFVWPQGGLKVEAESCPDVKIIFARGSGETRWENQNYLAFRDRIDEKLKSVGVRYEFLDLDYPAIGVGIDNLAVTAGAFFGGGEAYEFGASVNAGVEELTRIVNNGSCSRTKYVLGGYSQGAMVVSKALKSLNANRVIYAATFGDPKLYLPEGAGLMPAACRGANLSNYRMYVPDCYAYKGLLGAYQPYEPENFLDKVGTWCNKRDIFCSSRLSMSDHTAYVSDNLYEDASRVIVGKIAATFGIDNAYTSPHDTAILIDSTGSMDPLINMFKAEALRLANETFESGGRVALYDYRDLGDPYLPVARCDFDTCTAENFQSYLDAIVTGGGGDWRESMLSASVTVMNKLSWRPFATKSLVVLTDAPFLSPDRDATTVDDVVKLSKRIDPVNIYVVTTDLIVSGFLEVGELAEATGGFATDKLGELNLLTDYIMGRYDTLPRVEEEMRDEEVPILTIDEVSDNYDSVTVSFSGSATSAIAILNEAALGTTTEQSITLTDLDRNVENVLQLVPINDSRKGEVAEVVLPIATRPVEDTPAETAIEVDDEGKGGNINGGSTDATEPGNEAAQTGETERGDETGQTDTVEQTVESPAGEAGSTNEASKANASEPGGILIPKAPNTGMPGF